MAAAILAVTWVSETQASPNLARSLADAQHATAARKINSVGTAGDGDFEASPPGRGGIDKSVQVVQATTSDTGQSPERLSCELANARRDIELLQHLEQERARAKRLEQDLAASRRDVETQTALAAKASEEVLRQKQAAEADTAKLRQTQSKADVLAQDLSLTRSAISACEAQARKAGDEAAELRQATADSAPSLRKSAQEARDRAERLEQELATARRDLETRAALATKASEAARASETAERDSTALRNSLQQERARAKRLEQDLAASRRDVETQTALAAKASEEVLRQKQAAEADAAKLRQTQASAAALAQDLSLTRSAVYAYEAQTRKAGDEAAELRRAAADSAPSLRKSAQEARDRAERLEQDLATARRDLETRAALATKASEEAARARETAERDSAALRNSLQQERAKTERLERDIALVKGAAPNVVTIGSTTGDKAVEAAAANPIAERTPTTPARGDAQPNSEQIAVTTGLVARASALLQQGDIGAARLVLERAVEMGSSQASFALAETYDPSILVKWGTYGTRGDASKARDLYARADAAGIQEAKARLEALRR